MKILEICLIVIASCEVLRIFFHLYHHFRSKKIDQISDEARGNVEHWKKACDHWQMAANSFQKDNCVLMETLRALKKKVKYED